MALALQTLWRVKKSQQRNKNERKFQDSQRLGRYINAVMIIPPLPIIHHHHISLHNCRALLLASLILLPLLGLTWAFGTLIVNANSTAVAWLFTIFNSLQVSSTSSCNWILGIIIIIITQGMFIFFFHVVRNDKVLIIKKKHNTI